MDATTRTLHPGKIGEHEMMNESCPQCNTTVPPYVIGKDSKYGPIHIHCPVCGCTSDGWATELLAWAAWNRSIERLKEKEWWFCFGARI